MNEPQRTQRKARNFSVFSAICSKGLELGKCAGMRVGELVD